LVTPVIEDLVSRGPLGIAVGVAAGDAKPRADGDIEAGDLIGIAVTVAPGVEGSGSVDGSDSFVSAIAAGSIDGPSPAVVGGVRSDLVLIQDSSFSRRVAVAMERIATAASSAANPFNG